MSKLVQTCSILFKLVQTCSNLFKLVQTCPNLSTLVRTHPNLSKLGVASFSHQVWHFQTPNMMLGVSNHLTLNHASFSQLQSPSVVFEMTENHQTWEKGDLMVFWINTKAGYDKTNARFFDWRMTNCDNFDQLGQLWQFWPIVKIWLVTILTIHEKDGQLWQF